MSVRVVASHRRDRRHAPARWIVVCVLAVLLCVIVVIAIGGHEMRVATRSAPADSARAPLDRRSAVAVNVLVRAGSAGARSSAALREVYEEAFGTGGDPSDALRSAATQRAAILRSAPSSARVVERTIPAGYRLTRFDVSGASVLVWSVHVAGSDRGARLPASWWLTTRVDLAPREGRWRVVRAVAVQGPAPRLIRVQQAGIGRTRDLRMMLTATRRLRDVP